jgi:SAM-dependent methyltransferase
MSWDERYRIGDYPTAPSDIVVEIASQLPPGRALDLACGAGRNALWLAARGWKVIAIDTSLEALHLLRGATGVLACRLDLEAIDALPFNDATFDLVLVIRFTHLQTFEEAKRVSRQTTIVQPCESGRYAVTDLGPEWRRAAQNSFIHSKTA